MRISRNFKVDDWRALSFADESDGDRPRTFVERAFCESRSADTGFAPDVSGFEPNDDRLCASAVGRAQRDLRRARDTAAGDGHGKRNARATSGDGDRR